MLWFNKEWYREQFLMELKVFNKKVQLELIKMTCNSIYNKTNNKQI